MPELSLYTTSFDSIDVRFVYLPERQAIFVARDDLFAAVNSCMCGIDNETTNVMLQGGLRAFTDAEDKKAAIIDVDTIGSVLNIFSVTELLSAFAQLHNVNDKALRESAFRVNTLLRWYVRAIGSAREYFGLDFHDVIKMSVARLDRYDPPFLVNVTVQDNIWTAECDALGLVTEAGSYEELIERAWEIAPDLAELNGVAGTTGDVRLRFEHEPMSHQIAL